MSEAHLRDEDACFAQSARKEVSFHGAVRAALWEARMKWVLIIIGILVIIVGAIWLLQGVNVLPYGVMAGRRRWIIIGAVLDIIGIVLIVVGARLRRARKA
jgi:uncharacterized integral membrane protein